MSEHVDAESFAPRLLKIAMPFIESEHAHDWLLDTFPSTA